MTGLELREIRVFLTLAEELHFGRTAERLGITHSRVSQTIRVLEARVGGRLFERTSRRVQLTPLGRRLRDSVAPGYEQIERAFKDARGATIGLTGPLRIGMYTTVNGGPYMIEIVKAFEQRHPGCEVAFIDTGLVRTHLEWLRSGDVDMLAMRLPIAAPDITIGPILSREARVLAVARDDPLAERESVSLEDVADRAITDSASLPRQMMDAFIPPRTASGRPFRQVLCATVAEAIMRVAVGAIVHPTVASLVEHVRHPGIKAVPIRDLPPSETALIWLTRNQSPKIEAFAQSAASVLARTEFAVPQPLDDLAAARSDPAPPRSKVLCTRSRGSGEEP